jgi:hypothetical protein
MIGIAQLEWGNSQLALSEQLPLLHIETPWPLQLHNPETVCI